MRKLIPLLLLPFWAAACSPYPTPPSVNYPPHVRDAQSGCYWDDYNADYIWWFQAFVTDPNGWRDVDQVWADVYDVAHGDAVLADSFELYGYADGETNTTDAWFSDWLQYSTALDCGYVHYEVDLTAYDRDGETDTVTVIPGY